MKCLGGVGFCTDWAADAPDSVKGFDRTKYPPKDMKDLDDYVYAVVSHFKGKVDYWEGWNEMNAFPGFWNAPPSGRDPVEHYVAWQKAFYKAAKRANPKCVVLTGGFADMANLAGDIAKYYEKGLKGSFDVMNIHIYGADPRDWMSKQIPSVVKVMRNYGDGGKKIWITETGWPVNDNHPYARTLAQQAEWAPWLASVALSYPQVEKVFFFELRDRATDGLFGWYDAGFNPRPVVRRWKDFLKTNPRKP
jgi:polysaccharide biosynthesis protein PslG